nr:TMEM165/GDT1 family protein [Plesiomonas shigelloides]
MFTLAPAPDEYVVSIIATSFASVALAEMGDRTQLLTLLLVARFRKPWWILAAIVCATLFNHFLAAWIGVELSNYLTPEIMRWVVGVGFLLMAGWVLIPDKDNGEVKGGHPFWTSLVIFFIAEIGDKTQIATTLLGARYDNVTLVMIGSTLGMIAANAPMLWFGERLSPYMKSDWGHRAAAVVFAALGIITLLW